MQTNCGPCFFSGADADLCSPSPQKSTTIFDSCSVKVHHVCRFFQSPFHCCTVSACLLQLHQLDKELPTIDVNSSLKLQTFSLWSSSFSILTVSLADSTPALPLTVSTTRRSGSRISPPTPSLPSVLVLASEPEVTLATNSSLLLMFATPRRNVDLRSAGGETRRHLFV